MRIDFATDLAQDIGSVRWYRGFGLMLAQAALALMAAPGLSPVSAASTASSGSAFGWASTSDLAGDDMRDASMMPLGLGSYSGASASGRFGADGRLGFQRSVTMISSVHQPQHLDLVTMLDDGDSLAAQLRRSGANARDADRAAALVSAVVPPEQLNSRTKLVLSLGPRSKSGEGRPLEHLDFKARLDLALAIDRRSSGLSLSQRSIPVDATPLRIRGIVGQNLAQSAYAAGAPASAVRQYIEELNSRVAIDALGHDDTYDLIVDYRRAQGGERVIGGLMYAGLEHDGKPLLQLVPAQNGGPFVDVDKGHTDNDPPASSSTGFSSARPMMPVNNFRITSGFGMRYHPILGFTRMHEGIDLAAPWGAPIFAVADGVVTYAGVHGGHGNFVRLDNGYDAMGNSTGTGYAHMSSFAVSPGERVRAGQVIGYVGATGLATGPHLHFEVYRNGRPINPLSVSFISGPNVQRVDFTRLRARLARLLLIRPGAALAPLASFR